MGWTIAGFIAGIFIGGVACFGFGFVAGHMRAVDYFTRAGAEAIKSAQAANSHTSQTAAPRSTFN